MPYFKNKIFINKKTIHSIIIIFYLFLKLIISKKINIYSFFLKKFPILFRYIIGYAKQRYNKNIASILASTTQMNNHKHLKTIVYIFGKFIILKNSYLTNKKNYHFLKNINIKKFKHTGFFIRIHITAIISNLYKKFNILYKKSKNILFQNKFEKKYLAIFPNSEIIIYNILQNKKVESFFSLNTYRYSTNFLFRFLDINNIKIKKSLSRFFSNLIFIFKKINLNKKNIGYNAGVFFKCRPNILIGLNSLEMSINSNLTILNDIDGIINSHCLQIKPSSNLFVHQIIPITNLQSLKKLLKFINTYSCLFHSQISSSVKLVKDLNTKYFFISIPNSSLNNSYLLNSKNHFFTSSINYSFTQYLKNYLLNLIMKIKYKKKNIICLYFSNSIFIEENEEIIQYLIDKKKIKILPINNSLGYPAFTKIKHKRFNKKLHFCKRFYPHTHNLQTTFLCKFLINV
uniref:Nucleolar protein n=1 Tax=Lotharella vacuolata TaxID=74820 RepID=A0A0H5BK88_9EUKA|nr:nucleolar protein [Lotharella vacuolata]